MPQIYNDVIPDGMFRKTKASLSVRKKKDLEVPCDRIICEEKIWRNLRYR